MRPLRGSLLSEQKENQMKRQKYSDRVKIKIELASQLRPMERNERHGTYERGAKEFCRSFWHSRQGVPVKVSGHESIGQDQLK